MGKQSVQHNKSRPVDAPRFRTVFVFVLSVKAPKFFFLAFPLVPASSFQNDITFISRGWCWVGAGAPANDIKP